MDLPVPAGERRWGRGICDARDVPSPPETPPADFPPEPWRRATVPEAPADGDLSFTCPRCGGAATASTYGPCPGCRTDLRTRLGGERREVTQGDYVPKVNVTPDAVALKD